MRVVKKEFEALLEVERSSFYAYLLPIHDEEEAKNIISETRKMHPKARHCCYAYILKNVQKSSDDGEPKGTAGRPLLELLHKYEVENVILLVVRYFGGIKLGAGRLLRTYVESGKMVLDKAEFYETYKAYMYRLTFSFSLYDVMIQRLESQKVEIVDTSFEENVSLKVASEKKLKEEIQTLFHGQVEIQELGMEIKERLEKKK